MVGKQACLKQLYDINQCCCDECTDNKVVYCTISSGMFVLSAGIVHSDLKPANFILAGGAVKLIDFGIAKTIQPDRTSITCDQIVGTFSYMSPEAISDLNGGADLHGNSKPNIKVLGSFDIYVCKYAYFLLVFNFAEYYTV